MLALTWWGWAGVAVVGFVAFVALALAGSKSWRKRVRDELVEHLRLTMPGMEVTAIHPDRLELSWPGSEPSGATFYLARLYERVRDLPVGDTPEARAARTAVYEMIGAAIRDGSTGMESLDADAERANVMPRLVSDAALEAMRAQMAANGHELPSLPSGVAGLSIVFVLDRPTAVAYLTATLLADLKLTPEAALDLGRANLAPTFSRDVVRAAVGSRNVNVVKSMDTFDAARLLLVPGYLEAGESLVALIPDRDTLVLTMPPADGNWVGLRKLAHNAAGDPLCDEPLVVTADGITRAA